MSIMNFIATVAATILAIIVLHYIGYYSKPGKLNDLYK